MNKKKKFLVTFIMTVIFCSSISYIAFAEDTNENTGIDTIHMTEAFTTETEVVTTEAETNDGTSIESDTTVNIVKDGFDIDDSIAKDTVDNNGTDTNETQLQETEVQESNSDIDESNANDTNTKESDSKELEEENTTANESKKKDADTNDKKVNSEKKSSDVKNNKTASETKTEKEEKPSYSKSDLRLLSCLIYAEAGNQSYDTMLAVANVVLNRVKSDVYWHVDTIKEVIYDDKWAVQFAVTIKNSKGVSSLDKALKFYDSGDFTGSNLSAEEKAMQKAVKAAKAALNGDNNIGSYLCFSNKSYVSYVKKHYSKYEIIDDMIFYRKE